MLNAGTNRILIQDKTRGLFQYNEKIAYMALYWSITLSLSMLMIAICEYIFYNINNLAYGSWGIISFVIHGAICAGAFGGTILYRCSMTSDIKPSAKCIIHSMVYSFLGSLSFLSILFIFYITLFLAAFIIITFGFFLFLPIAVCTIDPILGIVMIFELIESAPLLFKIFE